MIEVLPAADESVAVAVDRLRRGGLVAIPTETVYGLAADALNRAAVADVYRLKGRPAVHPLIVHLPAGDDLWAWADREAQATTGLAPDAVDALARALWPGPLTLVLWAGPGVPRVVTGGQDTVALRVPGNDTALALLRAFGGGVVAPSANRFGRVSPTAAAHVAAEFAAADVDLLVLDGGTTRLGMESTVVDLTTTPPRLLRPGSLPLTAIESVLQARVLRPSGRAAPDAPPPVAAGAPAPRAPGTLAKHYAPATPLRLAVAERLTSRPTDVAVIARFPEPLVEGDQGPATGGAGEPPAPWLVLPADAQGFAHELYAAVRRLDEVGASMILVEEPPAGDEWLAVRDRLERAAAAHAEETGGN